MSAIAYIGGLKQYLSTGEFTSESSIFRLHNQFTVIVLIGSSVLLTAAEFFGNPIACLTDFSAKNVINTFCWIKSTFTIVDFQSREYGSEYFALPGVGPALMDDDELEDKWRRHNYYQWVVFFLFFQAGLCYLPKLIWNISEGGLMGAISTGLSKELYKEEDVSTRKRIVIDYVVTHIKMNNSYVLKYWACEALCFINIISQLFLVDTFLGGEFFSYGLKVLEYSDMDQDVRMDPMIYVFPRMTKCTFHKFGPSGSLVKNDAMCILPLNIFNEKVFIFMWFWFVILAVLLGALVLFRIALFTIPSLRPRLMHQHNRAVELGVLETFCKKTSLGDWWIMYVLSYNIDPLVYSDIMTKLAKEIETESSNNANNALENNGYHSSSV